MAVAAIVGSLALASGGAIAKLPSGCMQVLATVECPFSYSTPVKSFVVPDGVSNVQVDAVGAHGGNGSSGSAGTGGAGADGADVSATVAVIAGETLSVGVGQPGADGSASAAGGAGGGGYGGGICGPNGCAGGGGGGGASDVYGCASLASGCNGYVPMVVAGGGGGGGQSGDSAGGAGGGANTDGTGASGALGASIASGLPGGGGGGGGHNTPGPGGADAGGNPNPPACSGGDISYPGHGGTGGVGGISTTSGGGGGGGYFGGGGGGYGTSTVCGNAFGGAGGGGGGSSYGPAGTSFSQDTSATASVTISYQAAPQNATPPAISALQRPGPTQLAGFPVQGEIAYDGQGKWSSNPTSFTYQWERCDASGANCALIPAATGGAYLISAADVGHRLQLEEDASNADSSGVPVESPETDVVAAPIVPSSQGPPSIAGQARVGQTLSTSIGAWAWWGAASFSSQWQRCTPTCASIDGAVGQSYALTPSDVLTQLRVMITASDTAGTAAAQSALVGPVAGSPSMIRATIIQALRKQHSARMSSLVKRGGVHIRFQSLDSGRLSIDWYAEHPTGKRANHQPTLVAREIATFAHSGTTELLRLRLTTAGRHLLLQNTRLKFTAVARFTSIGQPPILVRLTFAPRR